MIGVYRMQKWDWSTLEGELQRWFSGFNRQLTLAVVCGGMATLATYMGFSLWTDTDHPWVALAILFQNLGTVAVLGLLVWQIWGHRQSDREGQLDLLLADLTDPDPLKRLIAVRQITGLVKRGRLQKSERLKSAISPRGADPLLRGGKSITFSESYMDDCFRLMLSQESEEIVRHAILDGLQVLDARTTTTTRRSSYSE
jgi:hypothetical protein